MTKLLGSSLIGSLFMTGIAAAQTTTSSTTPTVPNTGSGDAFVNIGLLAVSAIIAALGALYLYSNRVEA